MDLLTVLRNATESVDTIRDASRVKNPKVLLSLLGPAVRGFLLQKGKQGGSSDVPTEYTAHFDWEYQRDREELSRLYSTAKSSQWDGERDLDWSIDVDPYDPRHELVLDELFPLNEVPSYCSLPEKHQREHRHALLSWMLSQFLHGEQGALFAACQVTEAVQWLDGKLYGSTQVVDEGRHVEVFHRYLTTKLERLYQINDNLYVVIDALMSDSRWDIKFLGMQIMVEGLALGAFATMRTATREPLLREMLKRVITDEARHVHFGVLALGDFYRETLSEKERREREDWAFEMALLLRNRFLAHEFYDEYYAPFMSRKQWNTMLLGSGFMARFRATMFRRIIPNLKRIGLLSDRIRPYYEEIGLLEWEHHKAAPDLTATDLLDAA